MNSAMGQIPCSTERISCIHFQIPLESFEFLTRIHYCSSNIPRDDTWGEHEIDHILFVHRDVTLRPNANEVRDYRYVNKEDLNDMIRKCYLTTNYLIIINILKRVVGRFSYDISTLT